MKQADAQIVKESYEPVTAIQRPSSASRFFGTKFLGTRVFGTALVGTVLMVVTGCVGTADSQSPAANGTSAAEPSAVAPSVVDAIHDRVLVLDAHADIEYADAPSRYALPDGTSRVAPHKLHEGGVDAVVMAVAVGPGDRDAAGYASARQIADKKLDEVRTLIADPANRLLLATSAADVIDAAGQSRTAIILGFQNARILGDDVTALDDFFDAGVRVFALTHMGHNDFADSSRPVYQAETSGYEVNEEHGGLSALGRSAIDRLNALGALIDVSQLSRAATLEVLERSTAPIIASHSNVQALSNVRRNLSDEEIDRIAENEGVIHVAAFGGYLFDSNDKAMHEAIVAARRTAGLPDKYDYPYELYWELHDAEVQRTYIQSIRRILGPGSVEAVADHIDYIVQRVGVDHVGIGNDFNHGGGLAGFADASEARSVTQALVSRGYSEEEIGKIWGGNFLRAFEAAAMQGTAE